MDFAVGLVAGIVLVAVQRYIWTRTPSRHARYRMRAKLAQAILGGKTKPVGKVRKGRLIVPNVSVRGAKRRIAAQRNKVLSVVRRDDPRTGSAEA